MYSDALAILNKIAVYLYRKLGGLREIDGQAVGGLVEKKRTEALTFQAPTTIHESWAAVWRLLDRATGPVFAIVKNASAG